MPSLAALSNTLVLKTRDRMTQQPLIPLSRICGDCVTNAMLRILVLCIALIRLEILMKLVNLHTNPLTESLQNCTGALLLAKTRPAAREFARMLQTPFAVDSGQQRQIEKTYLALVQGCPPGDTTDNNWHV